ncbi:type I polyketide synthase [Sorangium sp. So ce375]|uniref:type I polyketide synthase n=1 Tax=Sorangium sp. So ce375 TaxID=3133306 RepID=UPI003F5BF5E9
MTSSQDPGVPSPLQRAYAAIEALQARLADLERSRREPIAIVGMACRVPGAGTVAQFWDMLLRGVDAVGEVPPERWDGGALGARSPAMRWGAFLSDADRFAADAFGISPREAVHMDPQQRIFLEVAWQALEDAGLTRAELAGSDTGVFVAAYANDYARMQLAELPQIDAYTASGIAASGAANRLSYILDLRGPSLVVDTACSSSLVALHLACQSIRSGECSAAVVGGVSLVLGPETGIALSKWGMMAPDGRCKTFDARADGFVRGEGCGALVLRPLSAARRDRDRIHAVIRGSAINQDGLTATPTAPSGLAQQAVIRAALRSAGVDPGSIGFIEAHGTGTALGDPIEIEALREVYGRGDRPCALGAVKTNVGHLEAAAGVVGVIKAVLSLRHRTIAPNVNFERLSPHAELAGTRFYVPTAQGSWDDDRQPRRAAVSSFGFGGTNAHVVLEEPAGPGSSTGEGEAARLLPLSAHDAPTLDALAARLREHLTEHPSTFADACFTASARRDHRAHRLAVVGRTAGHVVEQLAAHLRREAAPGVAVGTVNEDRCAGLVFVFPGQGGQHAGMALDLLSSEPVFRDAFEACDAALASLLSVRPADALRLPAGAPAWEDPAVVQPALFAVQVALAALFRHWGAQPAAVVGHSFGEVAAAHVAEALDLGDAARVIAERSRLLSSQRGGGMAHVALGEADVSALLAGFADRLALAAVNGQRSTVVAGDAIALQAWLGDLSARGVESRRIAVSVASHCPLVEPQAAALRACLRDIRPRAATIPFFSTVTASRCEGTELGAAYWARNLREPVRFAAAVASLPGHCSAFLELGPHPVLQRDLTDVRGEHGCAVAAQRRDQDGMEAALSALGALYVRGLPVEWARTPNGRGAPTSLPPYPFAGPRYWLPRASAARAHAPGRGLLGAPIVSPRVRGFAGELAETAPAYLTDHRIGGRAVVPAAALVAMASVAASRLLGGRRALTDVVLTEALVVGQAPSEVHVLVDVTSDGAASVEIFARGPEPGGAFQAHARAAVSPELELEPPPRVDLAALRARMRQEIDPSALYRRCEAAGLTYGPAFRGVQRVWTAPEEVLGEIVLPPEAGDPALDDAPHPALVDAALQLFSAWLPDGAPAAFVPVAIDRVSLGGATGLTRLFSHLRLREGGPAEDAAVVDGSLFTDDGSIVASFLGVRARRIDVARIGRRPLADALYRAVFVPAGGRPGEGKLPGRVWVFGERDGLAARLAEAAAQRGVRCVRVSMGEGESSPAAHPELPEDFHALLAGTSLSPDEVVVWLGALSEGPIAAESITSASAATSLAGPLHLVQALARLPVVPRLCWVTRGARAAYEGASAAPSQAMLWGFAGAVAREHPELRSLRVDLDPSPQEDEALRLLAELSGADATDDQILLRGGGRLAPRLVPVDDEAHPGNVALVAETPGALDSLKQRPIGDRAPGPHEVVIDVRAAGVNFRDVLGSLGMYPGPRFELGSECAGVIVSAGASVALTAGTRVVAAVPGSLSSRVVAPAALVAPIPESLGFAQAATLPVAFLTAIHALEGLARLGRGDRILIHTATGGVGLAALQIARRLGAEVIATAGSQEKRALLGRLGVRHVFSSRDLSFADGVLAVTAGGGVDVLLDMLGGEATAANLRALAPRGRYVTLSKRGLWSREEVAAVRPDVMFEALDLGEIMAEDAAGFGARLEALLARVERGELSLPPLSTWPWSRAVEAFRQMAAAAHVGKIALTLPPRPAANVVRRDASYLVTGGLGGVGLVMASWLAERGAGRIVLLGRSAPGAEALSTVTRLRERGADVEIVHGDVADPLFVDALVARCVDSAAPLRGVLHCAAAHDDAAVTRMTFARAREVVRPKLLGALALLQAIAGRGARLDFFVLFSSAAATLGSPGQAAYAGANAGLDALAHAARAMGIPASSVQWGPWSKVGQAARRADEEAWRARGLWSLSPAEAQELLTRVLERGEVDVAAMRADWPRLVAALPGGRSDPLFASLRRAESERREVAPARGSLRDALLRSPPGERRRALITSLEREAARVLRLPPEQRVPSQRPLRELGLDSLLAVELRTATATLLDCALPATFWFDHPTLAGAADALLSRLPEPSGAAPTERALDADAVSRLSEDEAEALLLEKLEALKA